MLKLLAVWLAVLSAAGCGTGDAPPPIDPQQAEVPTMQAEVVAVQPRTWPMIVRCQGSLVADEVSVVGSKVTGRVDQVHVDLGDVVEAGDQLAALDSQDFDLEVQRAQAQLDQARSSVGLRPGQDLTTLDPLKAPPVREARAVWDQSRANLTRATKLRGTNVMTQAEYDQVAAAERVAEANYASALNGVYEKIALIEVRQAELSQARQRRDDAVLRAPFAGLVHARQVAPGTYVQIGDPIATLVSVDPLRFRGTIPERHAHALEIGHKVVLEIESCPTPYTAYVTRISPGLDQLSRALLFEAELDNPKRELRIGLFAEAHVVLNPQAQALIVPRSSIVEFAGTEKVWMVRDGVATEQEVRTGDRRSSGIEILEGLDAGDVILRDAAAGQVAKIDAVMSDWQTHSVAASDDPHAPAPPAGSSE